MLFDRICREHGVAHRLTRPRSPTTTGKVERLHRTLRREFLAKHALVSLERAQQALDEFVECDNIARPHQALGMVPPAERFRPGPPPRKPVQAPTPPARSPADPQPEPARLPRPATQPDPGLPTVTRTVTSAGVFGLAGVDYSAGRALAGQQVQVRCVGAVVQVLHHGELVRALPRRHDPAKQARLLPGRVPGGDGAVPLDQALRVAPLGDLASDPRVVRRRVDPRGQVSFAGRYYYAARALAGRTVLVRCAHGVVQVVHHGQLVRAWAQRHTPAQEQRLHERPNVQQRTAHRRPVNDQPDQTVNDSRTLAVPAVTPADRVREAALSRGRRG